MPIFLLVSHPMLCRRSDEKLYESGEETCA